MAEPESFAFLLVEGFTHLAFSCAVEPLRLANFVAGRELYRWPLLTADGGPARSSNGCLTAVDRGLGPLARGERLFLVSGLGAERRATPALLAFLRRERAMGRTVGAICSGAVLLAEAGLLDGAEAAVHWGYHDLMAERFPRVRLARGVFNAHPRAPTAAGGTAAADLMLHLVAEAHGPALAAQVADQMLLGAVREGHAPQRPPVQARHGTRNPRLARAIRILEERLEDPPRLAEVAAEVGVSPRQLERLFGAHVGTSPRRYALDLRLARARNLLVQTEGTVAEVAMASGFRSTTHFARAFRARFGVSPLSHRAWPA